MRRVCIALIFLVLLVLMDPIDQALSEWLRGHSLPTFTAFMNRSVFEGKSLGAGDFAIFLQIAVLSLWLWSIWTKAPPALRRQRSLFAYILTTSILTALCVHLTKGVLARPRPYDLASGWNSWHGLWQHLFQGWGKGSFPSGHTASAISLMTIAYALHAAFDRRVAWLWGALVLLFTLAMATSRIMVGAHWPTDTLVAAILGWMLAHKRYRDWRTRTENAV